MRYFDNCEIIWTIWDNFDNYEIPEDDFKDGSGEITPEADVAEAEGLHYLVQVLHVFPGN